MKKVWIVLIIAFVAYFLINSPEGIADLLGGIGDTIGNVFEGIMTFLTSLFS